MMRRLALGGAALVLALVLLVTPVSAQLFGVVFDPTNYANALLRYQQLQQQLSQMITTYTQIRTQYLFLLDQAQRLPFIGQAARFLGQRTPWLPLNAGTIYGRTRLWIEAANSGVNAFTAVTQATEPFRGYGNALASRGAAEVARIKAEVDSQQLREGIVGTGLQALGRLRLNETSVEDRLRNLESDTFTEDASRQTEVAVLNKINIAGVTSARIAKDTNYLLVSLLEQQLLDARDRREAAVQGLNAHAAFLAEAGPLLAASTVDTTRALTTFRIP